MESMSKSSFAGDDAADDEWLFFLSLAGAFNSISCIHWSATGKDIGWEKFNLFELVMDFYGAHHPSQPSWLPSFPSRLYLQLREKPLRKYEWEKSTRGGWNEVSFSALNNNYSLAEMTMRWWYFQHVDVYIMRLTDSAVFSVCSTLSSRKFNKVNQFHCLSHYVCVVLMALAFVGMPRREIAFNSLLYWFFVIDEVSGETLNDSNSIFFNALAKVWTLNYVHGYQYKN